MLKANELGEISFKNKLHIMGSAVLERCRNRERTITANDYKKLKRRHFYRRFSSENYFID